MEEVELKYEVFFNGRPYESAVLDTKDLSLTEAIFAYDMLTKDGISVQLVETRKTRRQLPEEEIQVYRGGR